MTTKKVVTLVQAVKSTVKVVTFGTYTTTPTIPYCVVKPETIAGKSRWRVIGHFNPAALYDLETYTLAVRAALNRWVGEDENHVVNELRYVEGSTTSPQALSDDKSLAIEQLFECPDFV